MYAGRYRIPPQSSRSIGDTTTGVPIFSLFLDIRASRSLCSFARRGLETTGRILSFSVKKKSMARRCLPSSFRKVWYRKPFPMAASACAAAFSYTGPSSAEGAPVASFS